MVWWRWSCLFACLQTLCAQPTLVWTFVETPEDLPNPERGFWSWGEDDLVTYQKESGNTLVYFQVRLDDFRSQDISPEFLRRLEERLWKLREAGLKAIVRCAYNHGENYPQPAPDAPLPLVLRHIQQLGPVFDRTKALIAWFEAGFIGAWGEWHTSANGLDSPPNRDAIKDALMRHFPRDRFILFRYPADLTRWWPRPLDGQHAFSDLDQARAGHHNDCFLSSPNDVGTYWDPACDCDRVEPWKSYIAEISRYVPISGETCALNPPRSGCPTALAEMERLGWTALNEAYHPEVIAAWKRDGCYLVMRRRLGYRLVLEEARLRGRPVPNGEVELEITLRNVGFAPPLNERPVYIVFTRESGDRAVSQPVRITAWDPRTWIPGRHRLQTKITLPRNTEVPYWDVALWLPDASPALQPDPRYAIRVANERVWDARPAQRVWGWNVLGRVTLER